MAEQKHFRICPICEAGCGLVVTTEDGQIKQVRANKEDVFSEGYICPKGVSLKELHEDPDRLRTPLIKKNGKHVPVSWEEAWTEIDRRLPPILNAYGPLSSAIYIGNPTAHNIEIGLGIGPLGAAMMTPNIYSAGSVDQIPKQFVCGLMYGTWLSIPVPDIDRCDYLLMLGANPIVSNGSLWMVPNFRGRLNRMQQRGGRLIVVDPRRTETAEAADAHHFIRPGSDALFLMAILNVLFTEGWARLGAIDPYLSDFDKIAPLTRTFTPEVVAKRCAIPSDTIRSIARDLAQTKRAALYGRMGTTTQKFGSLTSWLIEIINIACGNLDVEGGSMFAKAPAFAENAVGKTGKGEGTAVYAYQTRVSKRPEVMGQFPVACLAEEIETPGNDQIRTLITLAGNPVLSIPNGDRLEQALARLDFMVSVDMYLNETTRYADVILPVPSPFEKSHYDFYLSPMMTRNVARLSQPVLDRNPGQPSEWDIMLMLAAIAGGQGVLGDNALRAMEEQILLGQIGDEVENDTSPIFRRDPAEILGALRANGGAERMTEIALRTGAYGDGFGADPQGLTYEKVASAPNSIDLGPLKPRIPECLRTPSGMIECAPAELLAGIAALTNELEGRAPANENSTLLLFGRRQVRSNNSWLHNLPVLAKGPFRCTLMIHPDDAAERGIDANGYAVLSSARGRLETLVEITDTVMRGTVCLPHGWGHDEEIGRQAVAQRRPGVNANLVADDGLLDTLTGTAVLNGIPVEVQPI